MRGSWTGAWPGAGRMLPRGGLCASSLRTERDRPAPFGHGDRADRPSPRTCSMHAFSFAMSGTCRGPAHSTESSRRAATCSQYSAWLLCTKALVDRATDQVGVEWHAAGGSGNHRTKPWSSESTKPGDKTCRGWVRPRWPTRGQIIIIVVAIIVLNDAPGWLLPSCRSVWAILTRLAGNTASEPERGGASRGPG